MVLLPQGLSFLARKWPERSSHSQLPGREASASPGSFLGTQSLRPRLGPQDHTCVLTRAPDAPLTGTGAPCFSQAMGITHSRRNAFVSQAHVCESGISKIVSRPLQGFCSARNPSRDFALSHRVEERRAFQQIYSISVSLLRQWKNTAIRCKDAGMTLTMTLLP